MWNNKCKDRLNSIHVKLLEKRSLGEDCPPGDCRCVVTLPKSLAQVIFRCTENWDGLKLGRQV